MTQEEFNAKYNGDDKRTAAEKNEEFDCYIKGTDKLKPELKARYWKIIEDIVRDSIDNRGGDSQT